MEELLNKLIQRGWKPYGVPCKYFEKCNGLEGIPFYHFISNNVLFPGGTRKYSRPSLRQIVSKESGLWQFVCENELIKGNTREAYYWQYKNPLGAERSKTYRKANYQHRIIESALCDEDKLEKFLLENILIK